MRSQRTQRRHGEHGGNEGSFLERFALCEPKVAFLTSSANCQFALRLTISGIRARVGGRAVAELHGLSPLRGVLRFPCWLVQG